MIQPTTKKVEGAVTSFYFDDALAGWEKLLYFTSDVHFDSARCYRESLKRHLDEAKKLGASISIFGDWFDAMQGRFDPRRDMSELRPEYRRPDYYDFVVKDSADFLEEYAENLDVISDGNHEISVLKNSNTSLMDRLVFELNRRKNTEIQHGGYGGYVRYMIDMGGTKTSVRVKYFHGAGGDAPVTRGVIHTNRQAVYLPDANIVVNGHNHNGYYVPITRERLSNKGIMYFDTQHHIRTPGYKLSYGDGASGWDVTRGGVPKPIGGFYVRLYQSDHTIKIQVISNIESPEPMSIESGEIYSGRVHDDDQSDYRET